MDAANYAYFTQFSVLFELVSAYAGVSEMIFVITAPDWLSIDQRLGCLLAYHTAVFHWWVLLDPFQRSLLSSSCMLLDRGAEYTLTYWRRIRGRHRGLPQAIDRGILLPSEFTSSHTKESTEAPIPNATQEDPSHRTEQPDKSASGSISA